MIRAILDGHTVVIEPDFIKWAEWFGSANRKVESTHLGEIHVSTIFLGIDHGFFGGPLWFETMIFGGKKDGYQQRYLTWEQANDGHAKAVEIAEKSL